MTLMFFILGKTYKTKLLCGPTHSNGKHWSVGSTSETGPVNYVFEHIRKKDDNKNNNNNISNNDGNFKNNNNDEKKQSNNNSKSNKSNNTT